MTSLACSCINIEVMSQRTTQTIFATSQPRRHKQQLETGLCKQTLFSALKYTLGVPNIFMMDLMHLSVLNDPDLLLGLWRGTIKKYKPDDISTWDWAVLKNPRVWKAHGHTVAAAAPFIPSSFGRTPRNPAEKINSGYKAWEYQIYIYGLGPTLFRHVLP